MLGNQFSIKRRNWVSWALLAQVASSATNALLTIIAARTVGLRGLGAIGIAFIAYAMAIGIGRSLTLEPLILARSPLLPAVTRTTSALSVLVGLIVVSIGAIMGLASGPAAECVIVMGLLLPGLMLTDSLRNEQLVLGTTRRVCAFDCLWLLSACACLLVVSPLGSPALIVFAWGVPGIAASMAVLGLASNDTRPDFPMLWSLWPRGAGLLADFGLSVGESHAAQAVLGGFAGLPALGAYRGAALLLSPLNPLFIALPMMAHAYVARDPTPDRARRGSIAVMVALLLMCVCTGVGLTLLPESILRAGLGSAAREARHLAYPLCIDYAASAFILGGSLGLRMTGRSRTLVKARLLAAAIAIIGIAFAVVLWSSPIRILYVAGGSRLIGGLALVLAAQRTLRQRPSQKLQMISSKVS
jgi:hypothetical protein